MYPDTKEIKERDTHTHTHTHTHAVETGNKACTILESFTYSPNRPIHTEMRPIYTHKRPIHPQM